MAKASVPEDPKLREIVTRIEQQMYRVQQGKEVQDAVTALQKGWTDLKDYFIHVWVVKPRG